MKSHPINIILSTRNPSKAEQIKAMFGDLPVKIQTLSEANIHGEAIEDGRTLEENATKKVIFARARTQETFWIMAEDTGLFITELDGAPGIYAARWAGEHAATEEITRFTLDQLKDATDRSARFETVVVLVDPKGIKHVFRGEVRGKIAETPKAKAQPKMPYSPLFSPEGSDKVWAEMTTEEENAVSHRGKAFRQVVEFLKKELEIQ